MRSNLQLVLFFALSYGFSWVFWIPAALSGEHATTTSVRLLIYAGILGPGLSGVLLVLLSADKRALADYWARLIDFRRIRPIWYVVIVGLYPALYLCALLLDATVLGHEQTLHTARRLLGDTPAMISYSFMVLLLGPLPEEFGWRGYALDRLLERRSALAASLILGVAWAAWHLPLFFVPGSYHFALVFGSPSFWLFVIAAILTSILFTWIYTNNDRSILSAILFHFVLNYTIILLRASASVERIQIVLLAFCVALVLYRWTPRTLRG